MDQQKKKKSPTDFYTMKSEDYTKIYTLLSKVNEKEFDELLNVLKKRLNVDTVARIKSSRDRASSLMTSLHDFTVTVPQFYEIVNSEGLSALTKLLRDLFPDDIPKESPPGPPPASSSSSSSSSPSRLQSSNGSKNTNQIKSTKLTAGSGGDSSSGDVTTTSDELVLEEISLKTSAMSLKETSTSTTSVSSAATTSANTDHMPLLPAGSAAYSLSSSNDDAMNASSTRVIIQIYESILPVHHEPAPAGIDDVKSKVWTKPKWAGKFDLVHLQDRNMSMKRRLFLNEFDYIRELKMTKHRHQNLYTAEFIYKGYNDDNLYLLYSLESCSTMYLNELASHIKSTVHPSEYDPMQQLGLLRDISGALAYMHETTMYKEKILHGNLLPENIIIEIPLSAGKPVYVPKLYNFERAIEINRQEVGLHEAQIKEEFYNFGLIIFLVLSWTSLNKRECEQLHRENPSRIDLYEKLKLKAPYPYDAFKNRLFIRFCNLTSPVPTPKISTNNSSTLDMTAIHQGIKKTYNDFKSAANTSANI